MTQWTAFALIVAPGILVFAQTPSTPIENSASEPTSQARTTNSSGSPNTAAWEALSQGLEDKDPEHRKATLAALGTMGAVPRAVQMAAKGLQDKDILVRQTAAATLGEMGSRDAIQFLKAALDDNSPEVCFTAAKSLWDLGDDADAREIIEQVIKGERKDAPGKLQAAKREAKKKLRPGELALMGAKEAAGLFGPGAMGIDAIHEAVKDAKTGGGAPGRTIAAGILAKDPDPYALTLLEWATADPSSAVRVAVAKALGDRGSLDTIPKLMPLLSDDRHAVRYMAAASMVRLDLKYQR